MGIEAARLWQQVALGEDMALELKEACFRGGRVVGPRRDDLADGLPALANGRGGRVVLGVADERRPQGLDPGQLDALADLVTEICPDSVKPPLDFSLFRVPVPTPSGGGTLELPPEAVPPRSRPRRLPPRLAGQGPRHDRRVARKIPDDVLHEDPKLLMWYDQALVRRGIQS